MSSYNPRSLISASNTELLVLQSYGVNDVRLSFINSSNTTSRTIISGSNNNLYFIQNSNIKASIDMNTGNITTPMLITSNIYSVNGITIGNSIYTSPLQVMPIYSTKQITGSSQSLFTLNAYGNYTIQGSNVDVFYNGKKLGWISPSIGDYTVSYSFNNTTSNTTFSINLNASTNINDVVDITVWPIAGSIQNGALYQNFPSSLPSNIFVSPPNIGIGTATPNYTLDVFGTTRSTVFTSLTGSVSINNSSFTNVIPISTPYQSGVLTINGNDGSSYGLFFVTGQTTPQTIYNSTLTLGYTGGYITAKNSSTVTVSYSYLRTI